jgi:hypothetical protein
MRAMAQTTPSTAARADAPRALSAIDRYFTITERGSTVWTEVRGGLVTFFTMSYIIVLNPIILGFVPDGTGAFLGGGPGDGSNLATIAAATALAVVAFKGVIAYAPSDRDARAIAAAIEEIIDPHGIDEIAFVDMRGFYGLQLYLDIHIETIRSGLPGHARPGPAEEDDLCSELAEREDNVYALKEFHVGGFVSAVRDCAMPAPVRLGEFDADDNRIVIFLVPAGGPPPG